MCRLDGGALFGTGQSQASGSDGGPDGGVADNDIGCGKLSGISQGGGWNDPDGADDGAGAEVRGGGGVWGGCGRGPLRQARPPNPGGKPNDRNQGVDRFHRCGASASGCSWGKGAGDEGGDLLCDV